jgi:lysophospholipase L1-like esterase
MSKKIHIQLLSLFLLTFFTISCNPGNNKAFIKESEYEKPIKVACIGNSITFGHGIEHRDSLSYPAQLQRMLGNEWEVRNFGISARTLMSKGDLPYINEQVYQQALAFQPDVVLIKLGTNDTKPHNWVHKADFKNDYRALINSFQQLKSSPEVILLKAVPAFSARWGISDSIIQGQLNPMIDELAKEFNLHCIDLYSPFTEEANLFPDDIHPNAKGAGKMATIIFEKLTGKEQHVQ